MGTYLECHPEQRAQRGVEGLLWPPSNPRFAAVPDGHIVILRVIGVLRLAALAQDDSGEFWPTGTANSTSLVAAASLPCLRLTHTVAISSACAGTTSWYKLSATCSRRSRGIWKRRNSASKLLNDGL